MSDAHHDDHHDHPLPPPEPDVKASLGLFMWGLGTFVVLIATIVVLTGYFWIERNAEEHVKVENSLLGPSAELLSATEELRMTTYKKRADGSYQIPVERAMELIAVEEPKGKK